MNGLGNSLFVCPIFLVLNFKIKSDVARTSLVPKRYCYQYRKHLMKKVPVSANIGTGIKCLNDPTCGIFF